MPAILRASCVIPRSEVDGLRGYAADEDEFTLAAAALERLVECGEPGARLQTVHLVGPFPAPVDAWIPELLGHAVSIVRHEGPHDGILTAVRAAADEPRGTHAVVAVDSPETGPAGRSGAVAVALSIGGGSGIELVRPGPGASVAPAALSVQGIGAPRRTGPAFVLHSRFGRPAAGDLVRVPAVEVRFDDVGFRAVGAIEWVGDWDGAPIPSLRLAAGPSPKIAETRLWAVSEGAYVPRLRYLENLPSRWRFMAERCGHCETLTFPVRGSCRSCHRSDRLERIPLPLHGGSVLARTIVARGGQPTEFDDQVEANGPYAVVLVELAPMARVTLQVTDAPPDALQLGDRVDTRLRRLYPMEGEWRYGRKAVPAIVSQR